MNLREDDTVSAVALVAEASEPAITDPDPAPDAPAIAAPDSPEPSPNGQA
jgi:hypothetical protein